ncbi:hypothetical protein SDC9_153409 [bioreactor metagenome]|uniref:Uncharacterized protein n=1 Tax=bioreactor metagenome TaxID=1076179 RepID=A0A645F0G9_9ZZZZ
MSVFRPRGSGVIAEFFAFFHEAFGGFREAGEVEVEVGAEDVFVGPASGVFFSGAVFGEEEGAGDLSVWFGAGEVEFVAAQLFAFFRDDVVGERLCRDVADGAQAVVHFAAHGDDAAHPVRRAVEVFYFAREVHEAAAFGVYGHVRRRGARDRLFHRGVCREARGEDLGEAAAEDEAVAVGDFFVVERAEADYFRPRRLKDGDAFGVVEGEGFVARDGDLCSSFSP